MSKFIPVIKQALAFVVIIVAVLISPNLLASGLLSPKESQLLPLTIKHHHVDVLIEDGFATTVVEQEFYNPNATELEALYSFPIPDKAVVGEFSYWINGQQVIAEAVEKNRAKEIYQQQKSQGQSAAVAEKNEHYDFRIRVFPVPSLDTVKIRLVYLQGQLLDHGVGHYVYPLEEGGVDEQAKAFWHRENTVESGFSFNVRVKSGYPIDAMYLPSHPEAHLSNPNGESLGIWQAKLSNSANLESEQDKTPLQLNKDISVYWRLAEGLPARLDMVAYRNTEQSNRGTVKLTFTPGDDLSAITQGRDWVFILDKSGSMDGKYASLLDGVKRGLSRLPKSDRFKIVLFDNNAYALSSSFETATPANVKNAINSVNQHQPSGGTNLYAALEKGLKGLNTDRPTGVVLVTDGEANVGVTERARFLDLIRQQDVRLFTFIMGNGANKPLLVPMTEISNGFAVNISNSDDMYGHIANVSSKLSHLAFQNIKVDVDGTDIKDIVISPTSRLYRGEQLTLMGHYFSSGISNITLTATINGVEKTYKTQVELPEESPEFPELERLWAFSNIEKLAREADYLGETRTETEQAMIDIALEYGLLTDYTSLLVVEEQVFEQLGIERSNLKRVNLERQQRANRENSNADSTRADSQDPMFSSPAPTHSGGGGSLNYLVLFALFGLSISRLRKFRR
ncbi:VIT and vWA domain-containing protein [Vibrio sonorensis]|uniref:VIT and vWA domain-containing protein n=1 Tax=Vibrio sonorensis TaxID=1004316 RepID=UPI0008D950F3|nr:VIT and VWA domain-containing protein [Vibrio sonorensis]